MKTDPIYKRLAGSIDAMHRCRKSDNVTGWEAIHEERACTLVKVYMPSGSGWDMGTTLDTERSTGEKLVFHGSFHHMNAHGSYDGWTDHTVTVTGSLQFGMEIKISGRNRNDIKDHIHGLFWEALKAEPHDSIVEALYIQQHCLRPAEETTHAQD